MNAHSHPFSRGVIFDRNLIRDHVATIHGRAAGTDGVLVLSVFGEDPTTGRKERFPVERFAIGDVDGMVDAVMRYEMRPYANVYIGLQVMRPDLESGKRGGLKDIVAVVGLVADMDADTGKNKGEMPVEPSLVLETSPGNQQAFFFFDKPMRPGDAHQLAKALQAATLSDAGTGDVAHVWRVPGTLNWPSKVKIERGRSAIPAPVRILSNTGQLYSADALREALAPYMLSELKNEPESEPKTDDEDAEQSSIDEDSLPVILRELIMHGAAEGHRSHQFFHAVGWLKDLGWKPGAIEELMQRYPNGIASKYNGRLREEIERAFAKAEERAPPGPEPKPSGHDAPAGKIIKTSAEFVAGFVPPDYLIDGLMQRRFAYSFTGQTGGGKTAVALLLLVCIATGTPIGEREVAAGRVLFCAGENPDDVRMRWIAMAEHIGFDVDAIEVHFIDGAVNLTELGDRIRQEIEAIGPVIAIVIDTAAAHFFGKDENSNTEMKAYAQQLRRFNTMPGGPTVIVNSHPVKNAGPDNLTPRGGGAFMNELDGNFTCARSDAVVSMHWQGKFRGVEFEPLSFATKNVTAERLKDSNGRPIRTVLAEQLSEADVAERAERATKAENAILIFMHKAEAPPSVADIAKHMVFLDTKGQPQKSKTHRILEKLRRADLVKNERGESYTLTDKGKKVAQEASKPQPDRPAETSAEARNGGGIDLNDAPRQRFWWDND